jgi:hypothetical protein
MDFRLVPTIRWKLIRSGDVALLDIGVRQSTPERPRSFDLHQTGGETAAGRRKGWNVRARYSEWPQALWNRPRT